jgi:hypothetical protein
VANVIDHVMRDALVREFRKRAYAQGGIVPITHQAEWQLASEGYELGPAIAVADTDAVPNPQPQAVSMVTCESHPRNPSQRLYQRHLVLPRANGVAHGIADLGSFKIGKSFGVGHWAAGYAPIGYPVRPAKVVLVGLEYKTCRHEFQYLADFLLSRSGLNLKKEKFYNDPQGGRMQLKLKNGVEFLCQSWENRETLKGDSVDCYIYCEAYQLPGIECYTSIMQNLRERKGHAIFPTTCDRPWVKLLHQMGHGRHPDWHCSCGVPGWVNPWTFDMKDFLMACPSISLLKPYYERFPWLKRIRESDINALMTKERFEISWLGRLGAFFGAVYQYQMGERQFTPISHAMLWRQGVVDRALGDLLEAVT